MRTYGGRLINSKIKRDITERQELRDAIVWDVNATLKYCRVKIQGSDTYIKAYYNENFESTPQWLKPGNAVRITHPGGNKGRIEIVGHGILLPTAIPGGSVTPPETTPGDTVLTGCVVMPTDPESMGASVSTGTYRINGITYSLSEITMDLASLEMDRLDITMDGTGGSVTFDAASATYFRYDSIVVGTDGVVDVIKGNNASGEPTMPTTTADHVRVGWVLIYPGMTEVTQADINRTYSTPTISEFRIVTSDHSLSWGEMSATITLSMRDQYGRVMSYSGYYATLTFTYGNGTLTYGGASSTTALSFNFNGSAVVTYTRDGDDPGDFSPLITIDESYSGLRGATYFYLYNAAGGLMLG